MHEVDPVDVARRYDVDWLRIFACYLLFLFHVGIVFSPAPFYHVQNAENSLFFVAMAGFISLWHMPLFFLLAGWSTFASLRSRGARGFGAERVAKLLVPLIGVCAVFGPVIKYLELRAGFDANFRGLFVSAENAERFRASIGVELPPMRPFSESFPEFWPSYFTQLERFTWSHLWFVAYLLFFSAIYLPLFAALLRSHARVDSVGRAWVYAPVLPLALIQVTLRPHYPGLQTLWSDWANFAYYSVFLLLGFVLARFPAYERALHREWRRALVVALATTLFLLGSLLGWVRWEPAILAGSAVAGWCFVVALLGFARERLAGARRGVAAMSESAYPVYLLHQPAIVVLAAVVVPLSLGLWWKFPLLLAGSVLLTLTAYAAARRVRPLRFLLGMKPRSRRARAFGATAAKARPVAPVAIALAALMGAAAPARATDPTGLWWAEGGAAQVEIHRCGDALCGRLVWLRSPIDEFGCPLRDEENPDPRLRDRELLGIQLLEGLRAAPDQPAEWRDGRIYDPTSGRTYRAYARLDDLGRLHVRGFVGLRLLGRTATWNRVVANADGAGARCLDPGTADLAGGGRAGPPRR